MRVLLESQIIISNSPKADSFAMFTSSPSQLFLKTIAASQKERAVTSCHHDLLLDDFRQTDQTRQVDRYEKSTRNST